MSKQEDNRVAELEARIVQLESAVSRAATGAEACAEFRRARGHADYSGTTAVHPASRFPNQEFGT